MKLSDDEVLCISALLYKSKSKLFLEYPEAQMIVDKIHNQSIEITAKEARKNIKPGKWS